LANLNALDERSDDVPTRLPIGLMESIGNTPCELVEATQNEGEFPLQACFIFDLLSLCFHLLQPFSHAHYSGFKLFFVDQSLGITINQAGNALP